MSKDGKKKIETLIQGLQKVQSHAAQVEQWLGRLQRCPEENRKGIQSEVQLQLRSFSEATEAVTKACELAAKQIGTDTEPELEEATVVKKKSADH